MVHSIEAKTESGSDVLLVHLESSATVNDLERLARGHRDSCPVLFTRAGVLPPAVREQMVRCAAARRAPTALVEDNAALRPMTAYLLRSLGAPQARVCKSQQEALQWIDSRPKTARPSNAHQLRRAAPALAF